MKYEQNHSANSVIHDLIGVGVGPFNLSLAALIGKAENVKSVFLERKPSFDWHPELMFSDSTMQTSYLKDLVTPVDPTSPYSFLNYLAENELFYAFLNTQRTAVSRQEFERYCQWVSQRVGDRIRFGTSVEAVEFDDDVFKVHTNQGGFIARNLCVATGLTPRIPDCAKPHLGATVLHAKSPALKDLSLEGKRVTIIGGGQTGIEVFRNALHDRWGRVSGLRLVTSRKSLESLDESAFTNEYFTPSYLEQFWDLNPETKHQIVDSQKLASDGNTPGYLSLLYNDLYRIKHVEADSRPIEILACRRMTALSPNGNTWDMDLRNTLLDRTETCSSDVVILATGFESAIPAALRPLMDRIPLDSRGQLKFRKNYSIEWDGPASNRIYALNFSRYNHGIIDPQTSMMAWRSAVVVNDLAGATIYRTEPHLKNFIDYGFAKNQNSL
jgi:lysine N6-hydroxylase